MRKVRLGASILALTGLAAATAPAAMIVHDPTSYVQLVQQAKTALDQLESLRTQVEQGRRLVETLDEASSIDDIAALLDQGPWRSALPNSDVFGASQTALEDLGDLAERTRQLRQDQRLLEPDPENERDQRLEASGLRVARDMALSERLAAALAERDGALASMDRALASAPSARAVLDLQAQTALEQTRLANDHLRLQTLQLAQAAEARALAQAEEERTALARRRRMAAYAATFQP
ncbi:type IV secretion system protein [Phenylobacterium sp.]|uniref:type IV secretion system protein n=1 Tax=Phenylobacterium sp. TaxID=1871053 RepID=UPI00272F9B14|nr:type IV secretion system protein [Phenylobacterium sp.]MDP1875176.1 type IV secretion system protein [Phenylobacterium sp.]